MLQRIKPVAAVVIVALAVGTAPAEASVTCTKVASPTGLDAGPGTLAVPYRSAQKLADSLAPGQTGCLRAGTYSGNVKVTLSGAPGAPLEITSYPGERATVAGKLWIAEGADSVTFASLDLDGRNPANLPSPAVNGDDVTFVDDDVTNQNTTVCFDLGPTTYGRANDTVIERNRIHNCGELPATNFDHGIYVEHATGTRIVDNVIYDNADRGVQLYPDAQSTYVARNVIDGNGEGVLIAGGAEDYGPQASSDNVIEHNAITNSSQRNNVEWHWGAGIVGERNFVRQNCIFGGALAAQNEGLAPERGYTAQDNLMADPLFVDRAEKDFGLRSDSPCRDLASYRAPARRPAAPGGEIVLNPPTTPLRSARPTILAGRVTGPRRPHHVVLHARRGKRWKKIGWARVRRSGRFKTRVRLQNRRVNASKVRLPRSTRAVLLRARARRVGSSNAVRVRVGR
jgi:hypothetical protein